ncbi:Crp/Fnr family transcriptional regulator [Nocardia arizonensis]|uniref:Crp/Fnr family transcriptional regulator n=1 Tax=Nocardia arizonensis TaxID=1141647 RepID=UPI000A752685|nr:cyclic nucleotide-binding domain-containing protein [Nocardia arizonensis]
MIAAAELARFAPLSELDAAHLATLARTASEVRYPGGHRLLVEGGRADRCWLIAQGQVVLDAHVPGRGEVVVQTLGPGDLLGWSWLVPPYRWQFGARTAEPVRAIEFDAATLTRFGDTDPEFGHALTRMLLTAVLDRLHATRARLLDLYAEPAELRVEARR